MSSLLESTPPCIIAMVVYLLLLVILFIIKKTKKKPEILYHTTIKKDINSIIISRRFEARTEGRIYTSIKKDNRLGINAYNKKDEIGNLFFKGRSLQAFETIYPQKSKNIITVIFNFLDFWSAIKSITNQYVSPPYYNFKILNYKRLGPQGECNFKITKIKLVPQEGNELKLSKYRFRGMVIFKITITTTIFLPLSILSYPSYKWLIFLFALSSTTLLICILVILWWYVKKNHPAFYSSIKKILNIILNRK